MASTVTIDLRHVARGLEIPLRQIQAVVELLDEGNTVPFITRYRKDQTGGLDEQQVREIQSRLVRERLLADRKQTILRSIDAQGKLTEKLAKQIFSAGTTKRLEDLYLPFKPKKQTLATVARSRGLEELAREILDAAPTAADLDARARDFVSTDRQVKTGADALLGAGHILAEWFSERAEFRQRLREILQRTGRIVTTQIGAEPAASHEAPAATSVPAAAPGASEGTPIPSLEVIATALQTDSGATGVEPVATVVDTPPGEQVTAPAVPATDAPAAVQEAAPAEQAIDPPADPVKAEEVTPNAAEAVAVVDAPPSQVSPQSSNEETQAESANPGGPSPSNPSSAPTPTLDAPLAESPSDAIVAGQPSEVPMTEAAGEVPALPGETPVLPPAGETSAPQVAAETSPPPSEGPTPAPQPMPAPSAGRRAKEREKAKAAKLAKKEAKKNRILERRIKAFRDYFNFSDEIKKIPPHRVLAINRGERARILRVKIESDLEAMQAALDELLVPPDHPHAQYLRGCARDALTRLVLPALERETRRELTDRAEEHAVGVFAKNLRNLLLQPPVHGRRVLAVDPGFKSGCKLAALDQFGNVLGHDLITLVGKPEKREEAKQKSLELIRKFELNAVAIGNGTGCRGAEDFFAELIGTELKDQGTAYVIVNEAGASVYSTSQLGREEFPEYDATLRGAVSIGRRLLDPLSELVKIEPGSIGVGLYQHDVKAKHLQTSLDEVVESCVNYVGVDVNTASPALLRYVSGLNQLTARRVYEHRREHGPFASRAKLRDVPGIGDATFVQAAGFLKITGGEDPLDATWIHPESYPVATRVLERFGCKPADLCDKEASASLAQRVAGVDREALAQELGVGLLTLKDILAQLTRPGRDPREDLPPPVFKQGVLKLEDLTPGMELTGTVLNVVDFGCFVDIGMHDSGLVHVSRLADRFIRDPHEVVAVGDIVRVWVVEVDKERRRVSLTMLAPGSERPRPGRREERRPEGAARPPAAQGEGQPAQQRPPRPAGRDEGRRDGGRRGAQGEGREGRRDEGRREGGRRDEGQGRGARPGSRPPRPDTRRDEGGPPSGDRPPRGKTRYHDRGPRPAYQPKPQPKPVIPITEDMKKGKEPMRTFGDLMQFFQAKEEPPKQERKPEPKPVKPARPAGQEPPPPPAPPSAEQVVAPIAPSAPVIAEELPTVVPEAPAVAPDMPPPAEHPPETAEPAPAAPEPPA